MRDEITFFHNPMSRGRIAHFMLEEVGAPYRIELLDFDRKDHKTRAFLAINPMGKVPTIIHDGVVVTEAAAICAYLADAFPEAGLAPAIDDPARGTYLRWLFFGAGCIEPALIDHLFARPDVHPQSALGYGSYENVLDTLEKALEKGPFILGERFSAADVYVGSQVAWGFMAKSLEPRPRFQRYLERVSARPAYVRFTEQDNALAKEMKKSSSEPASSSEPRAKANTKPVAKADAKNRKRTSSRPARHA